MVSFGSLRCLQFILLELGLDHLAYIFRVLLRIIVLLELVCCFLIFRRDVKRFREVDPLNSLVRSSVEFNLQEELKDRLDEVLVEVEVIVSHLGGEHHKGLSRAFLMQLLRMLKRDQSVFLTMDYESGALDLWHQLEVVEVFSHQETE